MKLIQKLRTSMAANIIGAVVLVIVLFGLIVSVLGYLSFTDSFKREYDNSTYHMASTAATLVSGEHIPNYLEGEMSAEYRRTARYLDEYCKKIGVSLVYVIKVDTSDYGRFVSIFNSVNNSVDNTSYKEWELGYRRDTTNDEYRRKYRAIYELGSEYETVYRIKTTDGQHPHITSMVPVRDGPGRVVAILCMQRPISELYSARRPYIINIAVSTVVIAVIASVFSAYYIRRQIITPILRVSEEATRFARENTIGEEPLSTKSRFRELMDLTVSINTLETDMVNYISNLTSATAERQRIDTELSLASRIQENSIPNVFPAFPDRREFDVFAVMDPAKQVGGDFYNFFLIDEDHLALLIGDVSGKGIPAALFMMVTNILISDRVRMGGTPAEILSHVNEDICAHNQAEMFVTVWLGIFEISTGKLIAANAGHEYPVVRRPEGEYEILKDRHGFVIGGMNGMRYTDYELALEPGSKLFLYTDGVPEATDAEGKLFGMDRTVEALNTDPGAGPEQTLKNVRKAVDSFVLDAEQFDDLTMLCLEYRG